MRRTFSRILGLLSVCLIACTQGMAAGTSGDDSDQGDSEQTSQPAQSPQPQPVSETSTPPAGASAALSWDPAHTIVFFAGVLEWEANRNKPFSKKNRRDQMLVEFFRSKGVPQDKIVYLQDSEATLSNIKSSFSELLKSSGPEDTLVFYYCGHGWVDSSGNGYYANYDCVNNQRSLQTRLVAAMARDHFRGKQAIFLADCCTSGSMVNALRNTEMPFNYGVLTSSTVAQNSTSNWTFSQSVLDALQGHRYADANGDGKITLDELGKYITQEMSSIDSQDAEIARTGLDGEFVFSTVQFPDEKIPKLVEVQLKDKWYKAKLFEESEGKGRIRLVYIGHDSAEDELWLPMEGIREVTKNESVADMSQLKVGDTVNVLWKGQYYAATIMQTEPDRCFVHYNGYGSSWDEWVTPGRIKN